MKPNNKKGEGEMKKEHEHYPHYYKNKCQCCGNIVQPTSGITFYWLFGKKFVYSVCWECWGRKSRLKIFLNQQND